ncbi:DNMT3B [Symbiodinium sp. CCMP2592]|nr:DNMT3B [Symbiodinium sp. CCMP2592]CAE7810691.1 DNMT3B [Symbiodinium sp. CCMP2592]
MDALRGVLQAAKTSDEVNKYLVDTLRLASLEDLVCVVSAATYETELKTLVTDQIAAVKDVPIELARLRAAWRRAKAELLKVEDKARRGTTPSEELDETLESTVQEDLMSRFARCYGHQVSVHMAPSDTVLARVYRELTRNLPTVIPLTKVRSLFQSHKPSAERKISLGGNVTVKVDEQESAPLRNVFDYYHALRVLGNAYAIAGSTELPSQSDPTKAVRMCPFQVQLDYANFVLRMSMQWEAPLGWVKVRDEATRGRMVELMRQGWSQGESLARAMSEQEIQWAVTPPPVPQPKRAASEDGSSPGAPPKKMLRTGSHCQGREICKRKNDQRGCSDPSCAKEHRCDVLVNGEGGRLAICQDPGPGEATPLDDHDYAAVPAAWRTVRAWEPASVFAPRPDWAYRPWLRDMGLKYVVYTGDSPLPQIPWKLPWEGPILVISLFDGIGALLVALMCMGAVFSAIAVEADSSLTQAVSMCFGNVFFQHDAEHFDTSVLRSLLHEGGYTAILVAGGSPCQDVSQLNRDRAGLSSRRTQLYQCIPRVAKLCQELVAELSLDIPVLQLLENVANTPRSFQAAVSREMHGPPLHVHAGSFGWCRRSRCFWGCVGDRALAALSEPRLSHGVSWASRGDSKHLVWAGKKPLPAKVHFQDAFAPTFVPAEVIASGVDASPFPTFTQEFPHQIDSDARASQAAVSRFKQDQGRFPVHTYESHALLWKGDQWRQPTASEKAAMMCIPSSLLSALAFCLEAKPEVAERRKASAVGNSFHVPSIMLALILLFQLVPQACAIPTVRYCAMEERLRHQCQGTVWQPGLVDSFPGLLSASDVSLRLTELFADVDVELPAMPITPDVERALKRLQVYTVDRILRDLPISEMGPEWAQQKAAGESAAALGIQKGAKLHRHAIAALIPESIGKNTHAVLSTSLQSPFQTSSVLDDDARFSVRAMVALGPFIRTWRRKQLRALLCLDKALDKLNKTLVAAMHPSVSAVASDKKPATMAALAVMLRWPDVTLGLRFVRGFGLLGFIESPSLFREIVPTFPPVVGLPALTGEHAQLMCAKLHANLPQAEFAREVKQFVLQEISEGIAEGPFTEAELHARFGRFQWAPMRRFMHQQSCGKLRPIDDGRSGGHNACAVATETIFTSSPDFVSAALKFFIELLARTGDDSLDWAQPVFGSEDMSSAYRQLPNIPCEAAGLVLAYWDPDLDEVRYAILRAHPFGLASAVVNFNRVPCLGTACLRRMTGACVTHFFDDSGILDLTSAHGSAQECVNAVYQSMGVRLDILKQQPMATQRLFLGVLLNLSRALSDRTILVDIKPGLRETIFADVQRMIDAGSCTPSEASKLRGRMVWAASAMFGRCGRGGQGPLCDRQYDVGRCELDEPLLAALRYIQALVKVVPPRLVPLHSVPVSPVVVYTDASFEPAEMSSPGLGSVIFVRDEPTQGRASWVPAQVLDSFADRATQIAPLEAMAVVLATLQFRRKLAGAEIIWFIDNQSVCASLVRGASSVDDMSTLVAVTHLLWATLGARVWIEWVDSESNPWHEFRELSLLQLSDALLRWADDTLG